MIQRLINDPPDQSGYHRPHDPFVNVPTDLDGTTTKRKLSLRQQRRNVTVAVTAFTLGALLIVCTAPGSKEFLVPGPLSSHHAPLIASEGGERCATCHANANQSLAGWIAGVFVKSNHAGVSQSDLCLKCHEQSLASNFALNPHSTDPMELKKLTGNRETQLVSFGSLLPSPVTHDNQVACSVCHQEHHGGRDLTKLTDQQCQSCHSDSFHSFESGHPEFVDYPQRRRARIAFDHASHAGRHFAEKQTEFTCNLCHVDDPFQNVKRLASFEQSCAQCHDQQIHVSNSQGMALIALPMLDMDAIMAAKLQVGTWPAAATGDFDGEIPPMMRLMLMSDKEAAEVLHRHGPDFQFFDFDAGQPNDVQDAVTLVWAIKRLLRDLAADGPQAMKTRLQDGLGFEISDRELQRIITNLDGPIFQNAANSWLPKLALELSDSRPSSRPFDPESRRIVPQTERGLSIITANSNESKPITNPKPFQLTAHTTVAKNQSADDVLAVNPLAGLITGEAIPAAPIAKVEVATSQEPVLLPTTKTDNNAPIEKQLVEAKEKGSQTPSLESTATLASGWFRNDQTFRISYRPSGHADDCLQGWIELVARATDAHTRVETKQLFEKTISMTGIGLCRTCHTLDQQPDRSFAVNWIAEYRDPSVRSFTRFAHGSHLLQPELKDCSHCHQLGLERFNADSFLSTNAQEVVSNFHPTTKADCVSCHQQGRTASSCTQCHNYHVGSKVIGAR